MSDTVFLLNLATATIQATCKPSNWHNSDNPFDPANRFDVTKLL